MPFGEIAAAIKETAKEAERTGGTPGHFRPSEIRDEIIGHHELEDSGKFDDMPVEIREEETGEELPLEIGEEITEDELPQEIEEMPGWEAFPDELDISENGEDNSDAGEQISVHDAGERNGLTEEEKSIIKAETGWPDEIIDHIDNMEQYEIYKNAGLHEEDVNGRKCLLKDIDPDYIDPKTSLTNRELMEKGRAPVDAKTGEKIELHHMGQDFNGPFAELCENSEHGDGNDSLLHDKGAESWRQDPEKKNQYNNHDRPEHWQARAREV